MNYIISDRNGNAHSAWTKAPMDINLILSEMGWSPFVIDYRSVTPSWRVKFARLAFYLKCLTNFFGVPRHSIFLMQYPETVFSGRMGPLLGKLALRWLLKITDSKFIILIHDLPELRIKFEGLYSNPTADRLQICSMADAIIAHNDRMVEWLANNGVDCRKLVRLGIFDYLVNVNIADTNRVFERVVTIAGNLRPDKCPYLKYLPQVKDVEWHLYGKLFEKSNVSASNIHYHGCFEPDVLPEKLTRGFGLVWDGTSAETCAGETGAYLYYNNPHKLSLYLVSGLPVVIWGNAAEAKFVLDHHVGITINSLHELPIVIGRVTQNEYDEMRKNCLIVSEALRSGIYTKSALKEALKIALGQTSSC